MESSVAMSNNLLIIMRGLSGSGKSTFARQIVEECKLIGIESGIASADAYFKCVHGNAFRPESLAEAHLYCFTAACHMIDSGVHVVIIDNTNIKRKDFHDYVEYAKARGYDVREQVVGEFTDTAILEYFYRNAHNCPLHTIMRQAREFEQ